MNKDFETFASEVLWSIGPKTKVEFLDKENALPCDEFKSIFPRLTNLINRARQTHLLVDAQLYTLFAWDTKDGTICGWLNKREDSIDLNLEIIKEHELLLKTIGGIQESFNQPEDSFSNNQIFMFIGSECTKGIGDWDDYYSMTCEEDGLDQIDYSKYVSFVNEANGALTLYDLESKKVLLFSHDHCFDNVEFLENQPEYTFHTFRNVVNFTDYVEKLATEWDEIIK